MASCSFSPPNNSRTTGENPLLSSKATCVVDWLLHRWVEIISGFCHFQVADFNQTIPNCNFTNLIEFEQWERAWLLRNFLADLTCHSQIDVHMTAYISYCSWYCPTIAFHPSPHYCNDLVTVHCTGLICMLPEIGNVKGLQKKHTGVFWRAI